MLLMSFDLVGEEVDHPSYPGQAKKVSPILEQEAQEVSIVNPLEAVVVVEVVLMQLLVEEEEEVESIS